MRRISGLVTLILCLCLAAACRDSGPGAPTTPVDARLTLAPGGSAVVPQTSLRIAFVGVTGDSRCPADALCIQGGDAVVHVRIGDRAPANYELHTGDASRGAVSHGGYRIALAELQPYPFSSRTIEPGDYRATLHVTR